MAVTWTPEAVTAAIRQAAMRGVIRFTEAVSAEGVRLIVSPPKTGRIYTRRGVKHQASAPGEPPASDTGDLAMSADTVYDHVALRGTAIWRSGHAKPMELGTETIEPRPFARPALANKTPEGVADIAAEIADALR